MKRKQFDDLQKDYPDALILFRCGDFYECLEKDADNAAEVLGIKVTKKNGMRTASFPRYLLNSYLPRLIRAGIRVAICEEPKTHGE